MNDWLVTKFKQTQEVTVQVTNH